MAEILIGKIVRAEFGKHPKYDWCLGLNLYAECSYGIFDISNANGGYRVELFGRMSSCKGLTITEEQRYEIVTKHIQRIEKLLEDAKCRYVSELVGKSVEMELRHNGSFWYCEEFKIITDTDGKESKNGLHGQLVAV